MAKRILLIDDDDDDRMLFCEALESVAPDFICKAVSSGKAAIWAMDNNEIELPDLIFLDVNMPVMDGWQCLYILKQHTIYKDIPVIMYSTSSHSEDKFKAQQAGALFFLSKPFSYNNLRKCLEPIVDHLNDNTLYRLAESISF